MGSLRRLVWNFFVLPFLLFVLHISSSLTFSDIIQNEEEPPSSSKDTTIVFGITPPGYKIKRTEDSLAPPFDAQQLTDDSDYYDLPIPFHLLPQHNNDGEKQETEERMGRVWLTYCDAQLGCLRLTPIWYHPIRRPVNLKPWPRDRIFTKFTLHTREAHDMVVYLYANETSTITSSTFKASRLTKILTHGFFNTGYEEIYQNITTNLLINGDYNVIVTHWGPGAGSKLTDYFQAAANSRVVGLEIASLVNTMVDKIGVNPKDVHLIGHSLGAHISGYAGQEIANLGRITGLDPAGPLFTGMPAIVKLDPSDAEFVDVYHTDSGYFKGNVGFGTRDPMGHLDIYPNGGDTQPGCDVPSPLSLLNSRSDVNTEKCSHNRARELFRDSLVSSCQAVAYECTNYNTFIKGDCYSCGDDNSRCAPVGIRSNLYPVKNRTNIQLYYITPSNSPFCVYQYGIKIRITNSASMMSRSLKGILSISLKGDGGSTNPAVQLEDSSLKVKEMVSFRRAEEKNFLITDSLNFGKIKQIALSWSHQNSGLLDTCLNYCDLSVASVSVSSINYYPEVNRLANTYYACPPLNVVINSKSTIFFDITQNDVSC